MHALPSLPRNPLLLGLVVLAFALLLLAAAAPDLATLDLSFGGASAGGTTESLTAPGEATWARDPLASPLERLSRP